MLLPSLIDEVLKFVERKFYMRTAPADQRMNGKAIHPKAE
jgi:hypothetical protein